MCSDKLYIFDFDNTLIKTTAKIKVICSKLGHTIRTLDSEEFNNYQKEEDHYLDFNEFECPDILSKEVTHERIFNSLIKKHRAGGKISIVTARGSSKLIWDFLSNLGISIDQKMIIAVHEKEFPHDGTISERKRKAIEDLIVSGYSSIEFIDDSMDNLIEVSTLRDIYNISLKITHVKDGKPKTIRGLQSGEIRIDQ